MSVRSRILLGAASLMLFGMMNISALTATRIKGGRVIPPGNTSAVNRPPLRPINIDPANGAYVKALGDSLVLRATAFRDPDKPRSANGRQLYAQWVVKTAADGATVIDSGATTRALNMFSVSAAQLQTSVTYCWTVRYADASTKADSMWSAWSLPTKFLILPSVIKELTPATVIQGVVRQGEPVYADKQLPVILSAPPQLQGNPFLRTLDADAKTSGPGTLISFKSDLPGRVVVAYDNRATTLPQWLWSFSAWKPQCPGQTAGPRPAQPVKLVVLDSKAPMRKLYYKTFGTSQTVELGMNLPTPGTTTTTQALKMYSVIVEPNFASVIPTPTPKPTPTPRPVHTPKPRVTPKAHPKR